MSKVKRKAPQKECPECNTLVHARVSFCNNCKHTFYIKKNAKQDLLAKNWRELQAGDIIKVISASGPYYLSKTRTNDDGSPLKIMMGQKGRFEVVEIYGHDRPDGCGIVGRQVNSRGYRSNVIEYIYMGKSWYNEDLSIHERPHKIRVLKKKEPVGST